MILDSAARRTPSVNPSDWSGLKVIQHFLVIGLLLVFTGCSGTQENREESTDPPEVLYQQGVEAIKADKYKTAVARFEELDRKHPFSPWATRAQLNLIYANYQLGEYEEALAATRRYIRLHPRNRHVTYAYYMRGLAFYQQISTAHRDQGRTREAIVAFKELITRFPDSDYAWEANRMLVLCRFRLAEQEMVVGRYYLDRSEYIAAIKRFSGVVDDDEYNGTPFVEEALFSLALGSFKLGLKEEARNYAVVLGHNFPNGMFYKWAIGMMQGGELISKSQLRALRREVQEGSLFKQFFQGITPGPPSGMIPGS
ncbi:MAG: outer membrane protein assembly factor BamD [Magnetococcales bacterium]|nr:outer membrane protein assembly factor BamD [Magnetococcales bacterium]